MKSTRREEVKVYSFQDIGFLLKLKDGQIKGDKDVKNIRKPSEEANKAMAKA